MKILGFPSKEELLLLQLHYIKMRRAVHYLNKHYGFHLHNKRKVKRFPCLINAASSSTVCVMLQTVSVYNPL